MGDLHRKKVNKEKVKQVLFKKAMPYWLVAIIIAIVNVVNLILTGSAFGISSGFLYSGAEILRVCGVEVEQWQYMAWYKETHVHHLLFNHYTVVILFIGIGSLVATLMASEFKVKKIKNIKQGLLALGGGVLMGFGTRLGMGCNIGALLSGISSLSLHGWVFALFMFIGAVIGSKILLKSL